MTAKNSTARTQDGRFLITTPFPTPEETAAALGIPPKRAAEIMKMMDEIHADILAEDERKARRHTRAERKVTRPAKKK